MNSTTKNTKTGFLAKSIFDFYIRDYGEIKGKKLIKNIIDASDKIEIFFQFWQSKGVVPTQIDLQKVIGSINWFVFSRRETMAVACLVLLVKWEKEVNYGFEDQVLEIGLSVINYYKVYGSETHDIIMPILVDSKPNKVDINYLNELLSKANEAIKTGMKLYINGVANCSIIPNIGQIEHIDNTNYEVILLLKEGGTLCANFINILPISIRDTFPIYLTGDNDIYQGDYIFFIINSISSKHNGDINLTLTTKDIFVEQLEGEIVKKRVSEQSINVICHISEDGFLFKSADYDWHMLFDGKVEEWVYKFE